MGKFLAYAQGSRGGVHRLGGRESGVCVAAQSWEGSIVIEMYQGKSGEVMVAIGTGGGSTAMMERKVWDGTLERLLEAELREV